MMQCRNDRYVVIGNPIAHSKSPLIHALFAEQTLQSIDYQTLLAPLTGFEDVVRSLIDQDYRGANVTVPFKLEAYAMATRLTPRAAAAGAVNTLSFIDGQMLGDNTDGAGLVRDIRDNASREIAGRRLLLIGAGGAARGALLPLLDEVPSELVIANRTPSKAQELALIANDMRQTQTVVTACGFEDLDGEFDIVINASASSLTNEVPAISPSLLTASTLAYDMMYGEKLTSFLQFSHQCGAQTRDGLGMLVEQAAEAFFAWRGVRPDTRQVLAQLTQTVQKKAVAS